MATDPEIIDALDGFDPATHAAEAGGRWGDTDAWRDSVRRTADYTAEDWRRVKGEADAIHERLVELFESGADADSDDAVAQAEAFRLHVSDRFYECPPKMLRDLGDMYVADPRFRVHYDGTNGERAGMAIWVRDAWHARAARG